MVPDRYLIPGRVISCKLRGSECAMGPTYFDANFLIHALLSLFYLLLELLDGGTVWSSAVGLEHLDIPRINVNLSCFGAAVGDVGTNSSERGVIFFSSISSSA